MIENYYNYCHQVLGIHMYTIPLIIVAVLMIVMGLIHWLNQRKRQEEFDEERSSYCYRRRITSISCRIWRSH